MSLAARRPCKRCRGNVVTPVEVAGGCLYGVVAAGERIYVEGGGVWVLDTVTHTVRGLGSGQLLTAAPDFAILSRPDARGVTTLLRVAAKDGVETLLVSASSGAVFGGRGDLGLHAVLHRGFTGCRPRRRAFAARSRAARARSGARTWVVSPSTSTVCIGKPTFTAGRGRCGAWPDSAPSSELMDRRRTPASRGTPSVRRNTVSSNRHAALAATRRSWQPLERTRVRLDEYGRMRSAAMTKRASRWRGLACLKGGLAMAAWGALVPAHADPKAAAPVAGCSQAQPPGWLSDNAAEQVMWEHVFSRRQP